MKADNDRRKVWAAPVRQPKRPTFNKHQSNLAQKQAIFPAIGVGPSVRSNDYRERNSDEIGGGCDHDQQP